MTGWKDRIYSAYYMARHHRLFFNAWLLRKRGVELGAGAWISGSVDLALAGRSKLSIGERVFIPGRIQIRGNDVGEIRIGDDVTIDSWARLAVANQAVLKVGSRVGIGPFCIFNAFDDLSIGDETMVSPYVNINCADHGMERGRPMREQRGTYGPVSIGRDCWLGSHVVVLKGVTIGDGAVVGAGALVNKDIPPYAVAVGVPAEVVGTR